MKTPQRIDLEKNIIGSVLCDDLFCNVAHILSHKNFTPDISSGINHQFIWAAIAACYPCKPISFFTVLQQLIKYHPDIDFENYKYNLIHYQKAVFSKYSTDIVYYSTLLLEQDIIDKYLILLIQIKNRFPLHETISIAAIDELYQEVQLYESKIGDSDILDIIQHAPSYLEKMGIEQQYIDELRNFSNTLDTRTPQIKKENTVSNILINLHKFSTSDYTTKALNEVAEIISKLLNNTTPEHITWLQYINTEM